MNPKKRHPASSWLPSLFALVLVGLVALTCREVPENGFHFDDLLNIVERSELHIPDLSLANLSAAGRGSRLQARPLPNVLFAIDWYRGGGQPRPFLVTNIAIHVLCTLALFSLLLTAIGQATEHRGPTVAVAAFAGAAVWAVHPMELQPVTYIVQRMASLAALFVVLSALCYLRGRQATGWRAAAWLAASALSFVLGLASKENAAVTPLVLVLLEAGVVRNRRPLVARRLDWLWLGLPLLALAVVFVHVLAKPAFLPDLDTGFAGLPFSMGERLLTQPRVIAFHLGQLLWPAPDRFSITHDRLVSHSLTDPWTTAPAILGALALLGAGLKLLLTPSRRIYGAWLLWLPLCLAVESSYLPLRMTFEHRMYLPTMGMAGLLALGVMAVQHKGSVRQQTLVLGALAVIVVALSQASVERSRVWRDDLSLWSDVVAKYPRSLEANNTLGVYYWSHGDLQTAIQYYEAAVRYNPGYPGALLNLGKSYASVDRPREALLLFQQVTMMLPDYPDTYLSMGLTYVQLGDYAQAQAAFERMLRLDPGNAQAGMLLEYARELGAGAEPALPGHP